MVVNYLFFISLLFNTAYGAVKSLGCYRDIGEQVRLMNDGHKEFHDTLTKDVCVKYCQSRETNYAGLKYGNECFCSRTRPSYLYLANITSCSVKCEGNHQEFCGDRKFLTVYDISGRSLVNHESQYVGCFEDDVDNRLLRGKMWEFSSMLTPDLCMGHCWRQGYRYAGVQYGTECHCGDNYRDEHRVDEEECSTPCSGDNRLICGSGLRMNIYSTGITDLSPENRLIGCFEDEEDVRILSGLDLLLPDNNSPKRCLNLCNSLGYKYSGVEFKQQCQCGNRRPSSSLMVGENECSIPCPDDDTAQCGGNYRILVYKSDKGTVPGNDDRIGTTKRPVTIPIPSKPVAPPKPGINTCRKSVTIANGRTVCKGSVLFLEDFNRPLDRTKWFYSVLMPWSPDFEFVVFTKKPENSFVKGGKLVLKPSLMEEGFVRRGKLTLKDCTGEPFTEECERKAVSYSILPPVESARLTTRESFTFKYGRVDIRAKLPAGDWLYPELWLEPKRKIYGRDYGSGKIRIAGARGNVELRHQGKEIGGGLLESGILLGIPSTNDVKARSVVRRSQQPWSQAFHNYTLIWTPENIWFMVDGQVKQELLPPDGGKLYELIGFKNSTDTWQESKVPVGPFDQECFISVGLSVGGIRNFPDNSMSGETKKPWTNGATKALANFFQAKDSWLRTWSEEASLLQIDSVKVTAI